MWRENHEWATSPNKAYTAHFVHPNPDFIGTSFMLETLSEQTDSNLLKETLT